MIVVKLKGGLGNQMFQYSAGRALAVKHNVPLLADYSFLRAEPEGRYVKRELALQELGIHLPEAKNKPQGPSSWWRKLFGSRQQIIAEKNGLCDEFFTAGSHVYLDGYWQSEKYFGGIRPLLLEELKSGYDVNRESAGLANEIRAHQCAISVHVRRGDYVSLQRAAAFHGTPGMGYYQKAFDLLREKLSGPHFYVFSDDAAWCRSAFEGSSDLTIVETESELQSLDMMLMRECGHHIIANSSYSWWGAWLDPKPDKMVIAPKSWFADNTVASEHIYGHGWMRV